MAVRGTVRKTTTAKRSAAPAKPAAPVRKAPVKAAAPAARKTAAAPAKKAAPAPKKAAVPASEKLTAYDVYRAEVAARKAQENYEKVRAAFEAQGGQEIQDAVAHAENFVDVATPPKREGRKPLETPSAKAKAKTPVIGEFYDKDKTSVMPIKELRELAAELAEEGLITETKVKSEILKQMENAGLFRAEGDSGSDEDDELLDDEDAEEDEEAEDEEYDEEDDDESEDSDEDAEDDEEGYTLEDLKRMKLAELQELAEQNEVDVDGMSKSQIIMALIGDEDDEEEDEEEPEDEEIEEEEDEEDEEDDEDVQTITLEDLPKMSVTELLAIARDAGVKVPVAKKKDKKFLIAMIKKTVGDEE